MDGGSSRIHAGLSSTDRANLEAATSALAENAPTFSAHRRITEAQTFAGLAFVTSALVLAKLHPTLFTNLATATGAALFLGLVAIRLAAAHQALRALANDARSPIGNESVFIGEPPTYTLLCPLYREAEAAPGLLAALATLDYPHERLDVKFVLEADDRATFAALSGAILPAWAEIVRVPPSEPRTKPKALNFALASARGEFVCVYDAEDEPDPRQLHEALDAFARHGPHLGCVQAPLVAINADESWISRQFALEYAIQFGQALPFWAGLRAPFAIGGTSNHFRMEALRDCGGWDPYNVTEDADIGFRLARCGWSMTTITVPTYEDAPITMNAWVRQRSRWIKGHMQTWLVLMHDPLGLLSELGPAKFCAVQLQLGGGRALIELATAPSYWAKTDHRARSSRRLGPDA
jgi:cellulose synthase/poly-beta-1,6-N-acetylglucosamine synthase-like glycosyltransferase